MTRILVVQTAFLGDVVLTTPLLRELRRAHPGAALTVVAAPVGAAALEGSPHVDRIVPFDKNGVNSGASGTLRLARSLRLGRFDLAVAAQRSARTGILLRASGAATRVGFEGAAGALAYSRRVPWDPARHAVLRYLALAGAAGGDPESADPRPELPVRKDALARVESLLRGEGIANGDPVLAIAPGSIWGTKRWTPEGFAHVARGAGARGLRPVLVGAQDERELCLSVRDRAGIEVAVLAGRTSLAEMTALLSRARALVTNDSGPGHVASAVGTAVVAIFGPTVPAFGYTPWGERNRIVELHGLECRPCHAHGPEVCPLGHHRCMRDLRAERVMAALDEVLSPDRNVPDTPRSHG